MTRKRLASAKFRERQWIDWKQIRREQNLYMCMDWPRTWVTTPVYGELGCPSNIARGPLSHLLAVKRRPFSYSYWSAPSSWRTVYKPTTHLLESWDATESAAEPRHQVLQWQLLRRLHHRHHPPVLILLVAWLRQMGPKPQKWVAQTPPVQRQNANAWSEGSLLVRWPSQYWKKLKPRGSTLCRTGPLQCKRRWDYKVGNEEPREVDVAATGIWPTYDFDEVEATTNIATLCVARLKYCRFPDAWWIKRLSQCSLEGRWPMKTQDALVKTRNVHHDTFIVPENVTWHANDTGTCSYYTKGVCKTMEFLLKRIGQLKILLTLGISSLVVRQNNGHVRILSECNYCLWCTQWLQDIAYSLRTQVWDDDGIVCHDRQCYV